MKTVVEINEKEYISPVGYPKFGFLLDEESKRYSIANTETKEVTEPFVDEVIYSELPLETWTADYVVVRIGNKYYLADSNGNCFFASTKPFIICRNVFVSHDESYLINKNKVRIDATDEEKIIVEEYGGYKFAFFKCKDFETKKYKKYLINSLGEGVLKPKDSSKSDTESGIVVVHESDLESRGRYGSRKKWTAIKTRALNSLNDYDDEDDLEDDLDDDLGSDKRDESYVKKDYTDLPKWVFQQVKDERYLYLIDKEFNVIEKIGRGFLVGEKSFTYTGRYDNIYYSTYFDAKIDGIRHYDNLEIVWYDNKTYFFYPNGKIDVLDDIRGNVIEDMGDIILFRKGLKIYVYAKNGDFVAEEDISPKELYLYKSKSK